MGVMQHCIYCNVSEESVRGYLFKILCIAGKMLRERGRMDIKMRKILFLGNMTHNETTRGTTGGKIDIKQV